MAVGAHRGANADEACFCTRHGLGGIGGKGDPTSANVIAEQVTEAGFVDGHLATAQHRDLIFIDVQQGDLVAHFC